MYHSSDQKQFKFLLLLLVLSASAALNFSKISEAASRTSDHEKLDYTTLTTTKRQELSRRPFFGAGGASRGSVGFFRLDHDDDDDDEFDSSEEQPHGTRVWRRRRRSDAAARSNETSRAPAASSQEILRVQVAAIHVDKSEFPLSKLLFKLTLKLALSEANKFLEEQQQQQQGQHRVKLALSVRSANTCSRQYASALAAEEYYVRRARLLIVSGCDDAIRSVSQLASKWQVPIITGAGFGAELDDKRVHRTLVRVAFSLRAAVEFLFKILKSYAWKRVNLIVDESDPNSAALRGSIEKHMTAIASSIGGGANSSISLNTISLDLQSLIVVQSSSTSNLTSSTTKIVPSLQNGFSGNNLTNNYQHKAAAIVASDDKWPNEMTEKVIQDTLVQCSLFSRVTIVLMPQSYIRKFMLSVYDQSMANGAYTFISMPLLAAAAGNNDGDDEDKTSTSNSEATTTGESAAFLWRSPQARARNAHAKQAFESLMSIYLRTPASKAYVYFASNLNNLANKNLQEENQTSRRNQSGGRLMARKAVQLNINPYSASFYDALQIYARALNESLGSITRESTSRNEQQQQLSHANISELVRNRRFENMVTGTIYINSNGDRETDYTLDDMNQMTGKYAPVILFRSETRAIERLARISWSSDPSVGPTSDIVDCNLSGTCASKPLTRFTLLLMLLAAPLLAIMSGLFYFVHSRLSLESQLVDYWWKIHLSEVEIILTRRKNLKDGSLVASNLTGGDSCVSSSLQQRLQEKKKMALSITDGGDAGDGATVIGGGLRRQDTCDKTEVTRATTIATSNTSGGAFATSAVDVCYGNITLGVYKLAKVALKPISKFHQSRKLMIELRGIKEINHANLCRFKGILVDEGNLAIVSEFCPKGSLRDFFQNESIIIDWTFKYSIINDIIAGLLYLHSTSALGGYHGRLKSSNCLVSARFVVKLSDYGPHSLQDQLDEQDEEQDKELWLRKQLWCAPEHIRTSGRAGSSLKKVSGASGGSMKGDVYSFGLLLYEIITNSLPFYSAEKGDYCMPLKGLLSALKAAGPKPGEYGPDLSCIEGAGGAENLLQIATTGGGEKLADASAANSTNIQPLVELMKSCWSYEASRRPTSQEVNAQLRRITRGVTSKKLLENLTSRMEQYTNNLESLVEAKLATLVEEKLKTEELLYQFVPKSIAQLLKEGQFVEPEAFECVTVFYSDIVGFTSLSSESSPMEVVGFLSDLYLCFDETLEQHDIFKVDTIGDAYIVASGLPLANDGKHVIEIACAALELRERLARFKIPHKPERSLEMRVGIHSGPCIAGIVGGLNMPKYCVFGDTLTTGKFMESSGAPMKIHITDESRALLAATAPDLFHIEPRTPKITKDGLPFQTYWLEAAGN